MRWARDVIAPLLVASAPQDAVCFPGGHQSSVGARWHFRHVAGRVHAFDSSFSARGELAERLRHDHNKSGVRLWSGVVLTMTAGSAEERGGAPTTTTPASPSTPVTTRYTIDVDVHPDVASVAVKHTLQLPRFLHHYPISSHTQAAYRQAVDFVLAFHRSPQEQQQRSPLPVVLDSGCGTGRSSVLLARSYPHLPVIGIDRSAVRLSKGGGDAGKRVEEHMHQHNSSTRQAGAEQGSDDRVDARRAHGSSGETNRPPLQKKGNRDNRLREPLPENLLLLRADLVDLWILASREHAWEIKEHYILYPNPYPKCSQLRSRWHGHSVFPVLLSLGGVITLRSNWRTYLDEVCQAVLAINGAAQTTEAEGDTAADEGGVGDLESKRTSSGGNDGAGEVSGTDAAVASAAVSTTLSATKSDDSAEATDGNVSFGIGRALTGDESRAEVPATVAAAAASYAASARAGPLTFVPAVPAATNFEAKYVAVGETVYELRLDPKLS
ncbi:unnamed protein product [Ectocarpus sp. 4 AP-2014]